MPRRSRRKKKPHRNSGVIAPSATANDDIPARKQLLPLFDKIEVSDAGKPQCCGEYILKTLDNRFYERNVETKPDTLSTADIDSEESKAKKSPKNKNRNLRFEMEHLQFLKNPSDIPHPKCSKSGVWIICRVDCHPKQLLYAVNCPFPNAIPPNGWFTLDSGTNPPPNISSANDATIVSQPQQSASSPKKTKRIRGMVPSFDTIGAVMPDHITHPNAQSTSKGTLQMGHQFKLSARDKQSSRFMVVSGGQTGVDRAALDAALKHNIPIGGWCPKGRLAEDGTIPKRYPLSETTTSKYEQRTENNVVDSDATLILNIGRLDGGTDFTRKLVSQYNKQFNICQLRSDIPIRGVESSAQWMTDSQSRPSKSGTDDSSDEKKDGNEVTSTPQLSVFSDGRTLRIAEWIRSNNIKVLNVAGPRGSKRENCYQRSFEFLDATFQHFKNGKWPHRTLFEI